MAEIKNPQVTVIDPIGQEKAKLRVAAYARVSSDSADQLNSYLAQVDYYTRRIGENPYWELADLYADEGISGLATRNRDEFSRMMVDCRAGKGPKTKKSKFRMESEHDKISKSKLRMETREDKLNRARNKLEGKKPPKPRGPVRRVLGAAGWNVHGFVHGKVYEVEHDNVGTEGAHRSELVGEAALRHGTRYAKKRIREHPARAVHKAEAQYIKARADYQFRMAAQENPELAKNAVTRYWHKQKLKKQYAKSEVLTSRLMII